MNRATKIKNYLSAEKQPTTYDPMDSFIYENRLIHPEMKQEPLPPTGPSLIDVMQRLDDLRQAVGTIQSEKQTVVDTPKEEVHSSDEGATHAGY